MDDTTSSDWMKRLNERHWERLGREREGEPPAGAQVSEHRRAASPPRSGGSLESLPYNLTFESEYPTYWADQAGRLTQFVPVRCSARTCPECGPKLGWETRQVLLERWFLFRFPQLATFTIRREVGSPESALDLVQHGSYLPRIMRALRVKYWVWVLEFQKDGWPHWHVLMDLSDRGPFTKADLRRLWKLWRDKWGLGRPDITLKRKASNPAHAINYITKYLLKPGYVPAWFLAGKRRRMIQASRAVGALRFRGSSRKHNDAAGPKVRRAARPLAERRAACKLDCRVLIRTPVVEAGPMDVWQTKCTGTIPVMWNDLVAGVAQGELTELGLRVEHIRRDDGSVCGLRVWSNGQVAAVSRTMDWASSGDRQDRRAELYEQRLQELLAA